MKITTHVIWLVLFNYSIKCKICTWYCDNLISVNLWVCSWYKTKMFINLIVDSEDCIDKQMETYLMLAKEK